MSTPARVLTACLIGVAGLVLGVVIARAQAPDKPPTIDELRKAVADLRAKGMLVVENVDKAKFQATLAPVYADFGKRFGQDNIDRIKNYK